MPLLTFSQVLFFLFRYVLYVYSWQNIPILLAYDVLVAAAFQKLAPFWRLVYEDNDNDKEKTNNDKDNGYDNDR
jgi:hypothetical protein